MAWEISGAKISPKNGLKLSLQILSNLGGCNLHLAALVGITFKHLHNCTATACDHGGPNLLLVSNPHGRRADWLMPRKSIECRAGEK